MCAPHTCVDELPAHSQHDLAIACSVGHQLQDLLVGFSFYRNTVDTQELITCPQTPVLLCCTQWNNSTNVHLQRGRPYINSWIKNSKIVFRNLLDEGSTHRLICSFPAQHSEAKAGLLVPFNKHVQFLGVGGCRYKCTVHVYMYSIYN